MSNPESILWVGGLADSVTAEMLQAEFITFGPIISVDVPANPDARSGKRHRGFAFVTFEEAQDAADAIDNMEGAVLRGRTLTVNVARKKRSNLNSRQAVWADQDAWYGAGGGDEVLKREAAERSAAQQAEAAAVQAEAKRKFAAMSGDQVADLLQGKRPKRDDADPYDIMAAHAAGKAHTGINFGSYGAQPYNHYGSADGGGSTNRQ